MNDIDSSGGMLAIQFLIFLGAVEGHLEFCIVILMAEMMLIILAIPAVILWGIKTIFGTTAAVVVGILGIGIYLWIRHEDKKTGKETKKMRHQQSELFVFLRNPWRFTLKTCKIENI